MNWKKQSRAYDIHDYDGMNSRKFRLSTFS